MSVSARSSSSTRRISTRTSSGAPAKAAWARCPHAGELGPPDAIRDALHLLQADRLRHGIRAIEDPDLVQELKERGTVLDVCPVSNVRVGVVPSLEEHPLPKLVAAGVLCSLSTDDPPMFDTDLTAEYAAACSLGLHPRGFYEAGVAGALCDEATKAQARRHRRGVRLGPLELDGGRRRSASAVCASSSSVATARSYSAYACSGLSSTAVKPGAALFAERAHHVEDDAGLARLVEVQAGAHREVEQVVGRQRAVGGRSRRGRRRRRTSACRSAP